MEILNLIFGVFFKVVIAVVAGSPAQASSLDITERLDKAADFLKGAEKVKNIFAWANALVPIDLILLLLGITGVYYLVRYAFSVIRFILGRL